MPVRIPVRRLGSVLAGCAMLAACGSAPSLQPDGSYLVYRRADAGQYFSDLAHTKAEVQSEAEAFAQSKNQVLVPISSGQTKGEIAQPSRYEYRFRLADKAGAAPRAATGATAPAATGDWGTPAAGAAAAAGVARPLTAEQAKEIQADLLRFDDLRKRGLITDAEYEALKKRLLER